MKNTFNYFYFLLSKKMEVYSIDFMRAALAIVYIWFGALKIIALSPATDLVAKTVSWFRPEIFIPSLGFFEVLIGLGLLLKRFIPITIVLQLGHMVATIIPFFILQSACFKAFPFEPTMEGQYIIKNLVLLAGSLVIAGKYNQAYYTEMNLKKEQSRATLDVSTESYQVLNTIKTQ
jgi:uncharacterized membrane protein YkgB